MCTAKIPPRPRLFLLAALFLLAGCSPQYSMRVISETDGHAYPRQLSRRFEKLEKYVRRL